MVGEGVRAGTSSLTEPWPSTVKTRTCPGKLASQRTSTFPATRGRHSRGTGRDSRGTGRGGRGAAGVTRVLGTLADTLAGVASGCQRARGAGGTRRNAL
jgi:hypothetical protein